jgi:di/tricarboxylate transporter
VTPDQVILFTLLFFVFVFLIWGKWRYDLVAFVALLAALLIGIVPTEQAFSGFGHPAVVIIALVLIVSRGLSNSGAIELLARFFISGSRKLAGHISIMSSLAAILSALMNNVAALALLMPVDMQAGWQEPCIVVNAAVLRVNPRRYDHSNWHAAEHCYR